MQAKASKKKNKQKLAIQAKASKKKQAKASKIREREG